MTKINYYVDDHIQAMKHVRQYFERKYHVKSIEYSDGLTMEFSEWRFNLRASGTENLLRLNIESSGNKDQIKQMQIGNRQFDSLIC